MAEVELIGVDADDTLWHSEPFFVVTQAKLTDLLAKYLPTDEAAERLVSREKANLALFGYGVKGFTLSMIETAIEVSQGRVSATDIDTILHWGKEMLAHPVDLIDGAAAALDALSGRYRLALITKGDLFHQESKIAQSGIVDLFDRIDILSEKDVAAYRRIVLTSDVSPERFVMVGNSLRSDILPVLELGGRAVYVPYEVSWSHEDTAEPDDPRYERIDHISALPKVLAGWEDEAPRAL